MLNKLIKTFKTVKNNKKGFTLIELIVVIAIIAILSLVSVQVFFGQTQKAEISRIKNDSKVMGTLVDAYLIENEELSGLDSVTHDELNALASEGKLYTTGGPVASVKEGEYFLLSREFTKDSKLKGNFYSNNKGDIYYANPKAIKDGKPKPKDETNLSDTSAMVSINAYMGEGLDNGRLYYEVTNNSKSDVYIPGMIFVTDSTGSGFGIGDSGSFVVSPGAVFEHSYFLTDYSGYVEGEVYTIGITSNNYNFWGNNPSSLGDKPSNYHTFISFNGEFNDFTVQGLQIVPQDYPVNNPAPDPVENPEQPSLTPLFDAEAITGLLSIQNYNVTTVNGMNGRVEMTIVNDSDYTVSKSYYDENLDWGMIEVAPHSSVTVNDYWSSETSRSFSISVVSGTIVHSATYYIDEVSHTQANVSFGYSNVSDTAGAAG